jgi:hypothetical protein
MPRPIARGVLSFGLVAIPVEIHTATRSENISFNRLHAECGSRVRNQTICPVCKVVVERTDLVRGYEFAKGQYARLTGWNGYLVRALNEVSLLHVGQQIPPARNLRFHRSIMSNGEKGSLLGDGKVEKYNDSGAA